MACYQWAGNGVSSRRVVDGRTSMTRILVADQFEVVREGIRQILVGQAGWEVVAEAANGKEAVAKAIASEPDVAVIEHLLPVMDGMEVTRLIHGYLPRVEILIFTTHQEETVFLDLLRAGARGILLKSDPRSLLLEAISSLADHKAFVPHVVAERLLRSFMRMGKRARVVLDSH
jgi:DNA-binding NarL/FixJ family response regulator